MSKKRNVEEGVSLQMERLWRPVFDKYDKNGDGRIECGEFRRVLHNANSHLSEDIPKEVLDELIERSQWCQDRYITFEEFMQMINTRELGNAHPRLLRLIRYAAIAVVPKSQRQSIIRRYIEEYNCMPPPLFLLTVSIVETVIFIYYCVKYNEISAIGPVPFSSVFIYDPCKRQEAWRFVTYMFIHAGFVHIFFNLLVQLILGIPLEMVHKYWRVGLVYLAGVIGGSLAASISDPHSFLAGASGGVYALIAGHLASVIINWKEMDFGWLRLVALLIFGGTDFGVALYGRYVKNERTRTSYAAHLAGAVAGLLMGIVVLRNLKVQRWERILGWCALATFITLIGFAILFNVANRDYYIDYTNPRRCEESYVFDYRQTPQ